MDHLFIASFQSRHFYFDGVGRTEAEAAKALLTALRKHAAQTNASKFWNADDFVIRKLVVGGTYRDGEII